VDKTQAKGLLKRPSAKGAEELPSMSQNQLTILLWLFAGHCHVNGHLLTLGLVGNPSCDRCKQEF